MFNQELKRRVAAFEYELMNLKEKYWDLYNKHYLLLAALGLQEVAHPAKTELVKKTGEAARGEK